MLKSATAKLTAWYLFIVILVGIAFSIVVYNMAVGQLQAGLTHQSARFSDEFPAFSNNPEFANQRELREGKQKIITNLVVFDSFVLFCAGFASYALARRTIEPMQLAHEQQKRFTADVSHELRTPLTALRMSSEVALIDPKASKEELRNALESNIEEADKMQLLVSNLLRLTKLETEELQAHFSSVAMKETINDAITQTAKNAEFKNISVVADLNEINVTGDRASLTQLVVILLDNAIKYSPKESVVSLKLATTGTFAEVTIRDNGVGIEPKELTHIFERFYRADKARLNSSTEGFGLGLSIAKHIADIHNSQIIITSRPGHGTTAKVLIPYK
jgi:signal transduction histidine kinase